MDKSSKNTPQDTQNHAKSAKLGQEGACRRKVASWIPKKRKWSDNGAPEGTPGTPQGTPKSPKSWKKSNQKFIIFPNPVRERILTILDPKIELKWVQNEVSESRGRGNSKKRKNLKFAIPSTKNTYFSRSENMQNWEKPQKMHAENEARTKVTLQKRFFMILPPFWSSQGSLKSPKSSQKRGKKKTQKKVLKPHRSPTGAGRKLNSKSI